MEILLITTLCITLSMFLCASLHIQVQSSHEQAQEVQHPLPAQLPRKLSFTEEEMVKGHGVQHRVAYTKQKEDSSSAGKPNHQKEKSVIHGSKLGTWQEWKEEGADTSQYFTMDYSHVRRRSPIHNKALSVAP